MAKPRVFISSTFFDLKQVRADLDTFIEQLGYEPIRNEEGDIPYGRDEELEEYCYKEIKSIDIFVCIIGGRFGSESKSGLDSITQKELKTAISEDKQVYVFIENNVLTEYETYLLNKDDSIKFRYVDDIRIYRFIEEIKSLSKNNIIKGFGNTSDIILFLREQFAGLFQRFLEQQTRVKEVSLIRDLEKTASTLNKMVNFLSTENKDKNEEVNKILMINHPLVDEIKSILNIPYNFYIEGREDMKQLFSARGYKYQEEFLEDKSYLEFVNDGNRKRITVEISKLLFEEDGKLVFLKKSDWKQNYLTISEEDKSSSDDDLPF